MAARGEDISIAISGPERLVTTADSIVPEAACTSTQFHVQTSPDQFADVLERLAGDRRDPGRGGRQLALPARQGAVARDPDPAVRAGHRHPQRGAEGPGRPAAGLVRRALDHLGVRPVRGERALLPGAAPDHRGRGPARGARGRAAPRSCTSCGSTTAPSTAGTGRSTTSSTASPTCGSRTAPRRRADGGRPDRQRGLLLRPGARARRERAAAVVADVVLRRRGELPRRPPSSGSTRQVYWPGIGQVRATELVLRRLLPLAHEGLAAWGVPDGGGRPAARRSSSSAA